jgi:hypothetical protein
MRIRLAGKKVPNVLGEDLILTEFPSQKRNPTPILIQKTLGLFNFNQIPLAKKKPDSDPKKLSGSLRLPSSILFDISEVSPQTLQEKKSPRKKIKVFFRTVNHDVADAVSPLLG